MQLGKFFNRNWVVLSIVMLVVGAGVGSFAATFEYGINPTNNRPNAFTGQGYISTSRDSRLFNATEADLQLAIYHCNDTGGGIVHIPEGIITLTGTIYLVNGVTLRGSGDRSRLYLSVNASCINITTKGSGNVWNISRLQDLEIYTHDGGYTGTAATIYISNGENARHVNNIINDVFFYNTGSGAKRQTGTALEIKAEGTSSNTHMLYCSFGSIGVSGFNYGINITSIEGAGGESNINANTFESLFLVGCKHMLRLYAENGQAGLDGAAQASGNEFMYIVMQARGSAGEQTLEGINITGNCNTNCFNWVRPWDWTVVKGAMMINISNAAGSNYAVENYFNGVFYNTNIQSKNTWVNQVPNKIHFTDRLDNNGTCTISSGDNSVVVSHNTYIRKETDGQNTNVEPVIMINPGENITACGAGSWWVDTITHTQFTLHTDNKVSSDCTFYWTASLDYYTYY